jgi:hypothetical protein
MSGIVGWEKRPENRGKVEAFKNCYMDHSIPVSLIAEEYGLLPASVSAIAERLGLPFRKPRSHNKKDEPVTTLATLDAEEQELKRRLFELQQRRAMMVVQIVRQEINGKPVITIQGLTEEPIYTTPAYVQNFLDGQGAGKLRDAVGRKS